MNRKRSLKLTISSTSLRYLAQEAGLLLAFTYLIIFGGTGGGLLGKTTLILSSSLLTLLALSWVMRGGAKHSPLIWPVTALLVVLLAAALLGIDPARSLPEVWLISVELFLLLLVYSLVGRGWPQELFVKALLLAGGIVSLFTWVGVMRWYLGWLAAFPGEWIPSVSYRLSAANMMAVLLNLLLMAGLARWMASRWTARLLLGLYSLSTLALLFLTSSRSGWLGTAAGLGALALLYGRALLGWGRRGLALLNRQRWLWVLAAPVLLAGLAAGGYLLYKQAMHPTHGSIFTARSEFWPPAWEAFKSSPWLGTGPFTFASWYLGANSAPPKLLFVYAHNLYLDVLHGSGLLGFAAFAGLIFFVLRGLLRARRSALDEQQRAVVNGALAALAAFGVHGVFDSVHHTEPLCAMLLAVLVGAALGKPRVKIAAPRIWVEGGRGDPAVTGGGEYHTRPTEDGAVGGVSPAESGEPSTNAAVKNTAASGLASRIHEFPAVDPSGKPMSVDLKKEIRVVPSSSASNRGPEGDGGYHNRPTLSSNLRFAASLLLAVLAAGFGWYRLWSLWPFYPAVDAANSGDWPAAVDGYREAVRRNPRLAPAYSGLGISLFEIGMVPEAVAALENVVELDPYYGLHWANLGSAYLHNGNMNEAVNSFETAVERAPLSALFWLQLGGAYEEADRPAEAAGAYGQAVELDSRLAAAYLDEFIPGSDSLSAELAVSDAQDLPRSIPTLLSNLADNPNSPAAYLELADALLLGGDLEGAAEVLQRAPFAFYSSTLDYLELIELQARLAAAQGRVEEASLLYERAAAAQAAWGIYGPGSYGLRLYAPYAYRVPGMKLEIIEFEQMR